MIIKYKIFTNLEKYQSHKIEVCFLAYIIFTQKMKIEDKGIKEVKNWCKSDLVKDIKFFLAL